MLGNTPPDHGRTAPPTPPVCEGVWRFTAPALDSSVPRARHAVRELLAQRRVPVTEEQAQSLLLIVSELVTNAVRHAALLSPQITVEVRVGGGWVRLAVEDDHPYRPKALQADPGRTGGRGLLLVQALAEEAGGTYDVDHIPSGGKAVWAALPLPAAPPPGAEPAAGSVPAPAPAPPAGPVPPFATAGPAEHGAPVRPGAPVWPAGPAAARPPAGPAPAGPVPPAAPVPPVTNPRRPR